MKLRSTVEDNDKKKGNFSSPNSATNGNILLILCPGTKVGSVIGKGDSKIFTETGVKGRVEEPVPGCDDR